MDVAEFMLAGATVVQIGAGSFIREPREVIETDLVAAAYEADQPVRIRRDGSIAS